MQPLSEAWRLKAKLSREAMLQVPGLGPRGSFVPIQRGTENEGGVCCYVVEHEKTRL